jgi:protein involved in polysaccharide export with SLBB domain
LKFQNIKIMNCKKLLFGLLVLIFASFSVSAQIQPGKPINITIANVPDQDKATITGTYPVSESGTINMPFIGQVRAAGLRNEQLAAALEARYKSAEIYRNPTIQVLSSGGDIKPNEETVVVGGQVRRPGAVPFASELTLWGAIQAAGGPTEFGSMRRVKLTRNGESRTYDLTKAQFKQIPLQRNDAIEVPQKKPFEGS